MVRVAIAGGTSPTLGKSIATAILATGKHEVVILSRRRDENKSQAESIYGCPITYVHYESIDSLSAALEGVHTVISVLKILDPDAMITFHTNIVQACARANCCRFAVSDWSMGPKSHQQVDLLAHKDDLWKACDEPAKKSGLECAVFQNSGFMNYFAQNKPFPKTKAGKDQEEYALAGLEDDLMLEYIDIPRGQLVIPADDNGRPSQNTMTHIHDIGKFVAAALDLAPGEWNGPMGIAGDTFSWDVVAQMLDTRGIKVSATLLTPTQCDKKARAFDEQLADEFSVDALKGKMVAQMMKVICEGQVGGSVIEGRLNELCPEIKPIKITEYIDRVWS